MLQYYRDLYLDPEIKHPEVIKWRLQHNAGSLSLYVITLCDTDPVSGETCFDGQLQFFHSAFLQQPYVKKHCPMIIGLARGREGAMELVCRIVQECLDAQQNADLVSFLARRDACIEAGIKADIGTGMEAKTGADVETGTEAGMEADIETGMEAPGRAYRGDAVKGAAEGVKGDL